MDPREYLLLRDGSREYSLLQDELVGVFTTPGCFQGSIYYSMMDPRESLILHYGSQGILTTPKRTPGVVYNSMMDPSKCLILQNGSQ